MLGEQQPSARGQVEGPCALACSTGIRPFATEKVDQAQYPSPKKPPLRSAGPLAWWKDARQLTNGLPETRKST